MLYEVITEGVATVTFNRPDVLNALTFDIYAQFRDLMEDLRYDDKVKSVVLTGSGRAFCTNCTSRPHSARLRPSFV